MMMMGADEEEKPGEASYSTPLVETLYIDDQDYEEGLMNSYVCCGGCFNGLLLWRGNNNNVNRLLLPKQEERKECYLREKAKKVREISEILAGPKWKNFIRRFGSGNNKKKRMQCQYDAQSYALNFDDGIDKEGDASYPDFLARYAAAVSAPAPMSKD